MKRPDGRHDLKDALEVAERVLEELVEKDPKLRAGRKEAQDTRNGTEDIGASTARGYRQQLGK